jgi:hypothetical protein
MTLAGRLLSKWVGSDLAPFSLGKRAGDEGKSYLGRLLANKIPVRAGLALKPSVNCKDLVKTCPYARVNFFLEISLIQQCRKCSVL